MKIRNFKGISHGFQNKLTLAFLLVSLIPLTFIGIYGYYFMIGVLEENAIEGARQNTLQEAGRINDFLYQVESDALLLSQSLLLKNLIDGLARDNKKQISHWRGDLEREFVVFSLNRKNYYQIRYIDETGTEIVRVDSNGTSARIIPPKERQYKGNKWYFIDSMKLSDGEIYISPIELNRVGGPSAIEEPYIPVIRYAAPVFDREGNRRGIVIINVFASNFLKVLGEQSALQDTTTTTFGDQNMHFLVDQDGYYIVRHNETKRWGRPSDLNTAENLKKDYPPFSSKILSGNGGVITEGQDEIIAYQPVFPDKNDLSNFLVVVDITRKNIIFSSVSLFKLAFGMVFLTALLSAFGVGAFIAMKVTRPIEDLVDATEKIAKGDLTAQVPVESTDEVGSLAGAFNIMARKLKSSYDEITKSHKKLQKAYDELEELDGMKDDLIANVSHELKTPLTICGGTIDLAMEEDDKKEVDNLLAMGKSALVRQNWIIDDLIDIADISRRSFKLNLEDTDLEEVTILSIEGIAPLTSERGIRIKASIPDDLPMIRADFDKLKRVFHNLLGNAVKFNRKGGKVTIGVGLTEEGRFVEVCITDTGIGIETEELGRIFDRFYQIDGRTTREYGGTGMGLAVVKEIVKAHGGFIRVESRPGQGSSFIFTLPVGRDRKDK